MDMRTLISLAKEQGWRVEKTKKGHHRFVSPSGDTLITSGTPSDWRQMKNFVSDLKRRGFSTKRNKHMKKDEKKVEEPLKEEEETKGLYESDDPDAVWCGTKRYDFGGIRPNPHLR